MKNENQPSANSLFKNFSPKNIVLLIIFIFLLAVAYKYIASDIQENKEKAVIQERAKIEEQTKLKQQQTEEQAKQEEGQLLENCISQANKKAAEGAGYWSDFQKKNCETAQFDYVAVQCLQIVNQHMDEILAQKETDINNCYSRHK